MSRVFQEVDQPNGIDQRLANRLAADVIIGGFDTIAIAMVVSNLAEPRTSLGCLNTDETS